MKCDQKTSPDRELCLEILDAIFSGGAYSTLEVDDVLDADGAIDGRPSAHAGFVTEVVFGVLRRLRTLDWLIERISTRPLTKISATVLDILRITLYQVLYMDSVPFPIAANEAVLLARRHANEGAAGFTNACLRGLSRRVPLIDSATASTQSWGADTSLPAKARAALSALGLTDSMASGLPHLGLIESMPDWMVEAWSAQYGGPETRLMCAALNRSKDVSIRTNLLRTSRDELMLALGAEGVRCTAGSLAPEAIHCRGFRSIGSSGAFLEGLLQVQDEGAMAVTRLLDPQPGETVMDVCAAPGGKATHCAELMGDVGRIVAVDVHEGRLDLVRDNAARLGLSSVECVAADARDLGGISLPLFDRIMVDAPCTGTGVVGRKPDIRWRRLEEDIAGLVVLQRQILGAVVPLLREGGVLLYSTCSLQEEENEGNTAWLLATHPLLRCVDAGKHFMPHLDGTDGFFVSKFQAGA